jgi:hypothetical protein
MDIIIIIMIIIISNIILPATHGPSIFLIATRQAAFLFSIGRTPVVFGCFLLLAACACGADRRLETQKQSTK